MSPTLPVKRMSSDRLCLVSQYADVLGVTLAHLRTIPVSFDVL